MESSGRTQAQRSADTQERIMASTLDCLIDLGYSRTTTKAVEDRAGVTRGAVLHHYPSKSAMLVGTVEYMARRWEAALVAAVQARGGKLSARELVDVMWKQFRTPMSYGILEIRTAARTDSTLHKVLAKHEEGICLSLVGAVADVLGASAEDPTFVTALGLTWQFMAGTAGGAVLDHDPKNSDQLVAEWAKVIAPMFEASIRPRGRIRALRAKANSA